MSTATVYFAPTADGEAVESISGKVRTVLDCLEPEKAFGEGDLIGVKMHLGEKPTGGQVPPEHVRPIVDRLTDLGAKPFLTDSCTLYRGRRQNAVDYLRAAHEHGYTLDAVNAPVIIADGLVGGDQHFVAIDKKHFDRVPVSIVAARAHGFVVLTHLTGHGGMGLGGAIKNMAMGLCSRAGKLIMHSDTKPPVDAGKCKGCGLCAKWCPADAIMVSDVATIDYEKCIGCGECYAVCRHGAIGFNWKAAADARQEKMAEAVLGIVKDKADKLLYLTYAIHVTEDCDCGGSTQDAVAEHVGILGSRDPIALDAASADLVSEALGRDYWTETWPDCQWRVQLTYGEELGLGTTQYQLARV